MSSLVPYVAKGTNAEHYQADMEDMADLNDIKVEIMERVQAAMAKAWEFRNGYLETFTIAVFQLITWCLITKIKK